MMAESLYTCHSSAPPLLSPPLRRHTYTSSSHPWEKAVALQYSCLENPMDRGVWWAAVHGVTKSWTQLSNFTLNGSPLQCSCLENPRDGGAWWAAIYGVAQSQTRLT